MLEEPDSPLRSLSMNNFHYERGTAKKIYCCEGLQMPESFKEKVPQLSEALGRYESLKLFPCISMGEPIQMLCFEVNC